MHTQNSLDRTDQDISGAQDRAAFAESPIHLAEFTVSVGAVVEALEDHPAWNLHSPRREQYVHSDMSDIWVRYNDWKNYHGDLEEFNGPHESVWYPVAHEEPAIWLLIHDVLYHIHRRGRVILGGVLITKIPPGGSIAPHVDGGWHAGYYSDKYAVQLMGNEQQSFNFDGHSLSALPGQVYWFDNSRRHWIDNPSDEDRMTMIICTRRIL